MKHRRQEGDLITREKGVEREKSVQEQAKQQPVPVKMYRTHKRLMIATPMAGLEPENILVLPISTPGIPHT
jgi:HSP20 family molecular chaperone IbpA